MCTKNTLRNTVGNAHKNMARYTVGNTYKNIAGYTVGKSPKYVDLLFDVYACIFIKNTYMH
jgi:hypothetical protein